MPRAHLGLKTSAFGAWKGYPTSPGAALEAWLATPRVQEKGWTPEKARERVQILTARVPLDTIWKLHTLADAFVSASHGEAWDLPAYDACLCRSRLVDVGFGGSEDYAPPGSIAVWTEKSDGLEACHPGYAWAGARWAAVSRARLREGMRLCFEERVRGLEMEPERYSFATVGAQMKALVERCLSLIHI